MSDEALRALEREARARPLDLAAGWAYAVGLERAGERRALWLELCRLARAGDRRAVDAVAGWLPGLGGTTPRAPTLRAPQVARVALIDDEAFEDDAVWWAGASPTGAVLALAGSTLLSVDPEADRVVWRQEGVAWSQPWGDDALVVSHDRTAMVRSAATTHADLGAGLVARGLIDAFGARSRGDRLVVHQPERLQLFDVGASFGQLLWQRDVATDGAEVHGDVVLGRSAEGQEHDLVALDLATGERRWELPARSDPALELQWIADDRSVVVCDFEGRTPCVTTLDLASGTTVWSGPYEHGGGCVALGPRACVFEVGGQLEARSREDGRPLWVAPAEDLQELDEDWRAVGDVVYAAAVTGAELHLVGVSLETGERVVDARARLPGSTRDALVVALVAHATGLDVLLQSSGRVLVVVRFAG